LASWRLSRYFLMPTFIPIGLYSYTLIALEVRLVFCRRRSWSYTPWSCAMRFPSPHWCSFCCRCLSISSVDTSKNLSSVHLINLLYLFPFTPVWQKFTSGRPSAMIFYHSQF
jgi:hypothetical protein